MGTDNQSPSYLEERERARRWLLNNPDGKYAATFLKEHMPKGQNVLDDDRAVDWAEIVKEHKGGTVIATNVAEAKEAFRIASGASNIGAPPGTPSKMLQTASVPLWYHMRRQLETGDPAYWNDPKNFYREMLINPQWCMIPASRVRAELEKYLPKGMD